MTSSSEIPVHQISGTHYQVGKAMGQMQKNYINSKIVDANGPFRKTVIQYYDSSLGRPICDEFFANTNSSFPQFMDEIKGVAAAVGVDPMTIFLLNAASEISVLNNKTIGEGCTTILLNSNNEKLLVHNEDVTTDEFGRDWIFEVKISPDTSLRKEEAYLAYIQLGSIAGRCFGFNKHGLVLTSNIIYAKKINVKGIPRPIIDRAILSASNIEEAIEMTCYGNGLASCDSVNIAQNVNGLVSMENWELHGSDSGIVCDRKACVPGNAMVHTNLYERLSFDIVQHISSKHRLARIEEIFKVFGKPASKKDALGIVGDVHNSEFPIYRSGAPPDDKTTAYTACFDMNACQVDIIKGNPTEPTCKKTIAFTSLH